MTIKYHCWNQWLNDPKPSKSHWKQWSGGWKSVNVDGWVTPKPLKAMVSGPKTLNGNGWVITKNIYHFKWIYANTWQRGRLCPPRANRVKDEKVSIFGYIWNSFHRCTPYFFAFCHNRLKRLVQSRAVSRRFLVQISAQNLSQISNVCVKVCKTQTQTARIGDKMPFTTRCE